MIRPLFSISLSSLIRVSILLIGGLACSAPTQSQSEAFPLTSLDLLAKHPAVLAQIEVNEAGIALYKDPAAKTAGKVEARIYPDEYALTARLFKRLTPKELLPYYNRKGLDRWPDSLVQLVSIPTVPYVFIPGTPRPLKGFKVALDPGHISGDLALAEIEGKYMKMRASAKHNRAAIAFFEPYLTMITALLIKDQLEALGATVMLTKQQPGQSVVAQPFGLWRKKSLDSTLRAQRKAGDLTSRQYTYYQNRAQPAELFHNFYNRADLLARADSINAFHPDLTLIIHYNIHSPNWDIRDQEGYFTPTDANYSMAFIPGAFYRGELSEPIDRLSFLRCLITTDVAQSQKLCDAFIRSSETYTGVKPVADTSDLPYLKKYSTYADAPGVFARNLFLTRSVWSPLCYGESLCQDNEQEALALSQQDLVVHGYRAPRRLEEVANAYVVAVMRYASTFSIEE